MVYYLYIWSIDISIYHGVLFSTFVQYILVYIMVYYLYICSININIYLGVLFVHIMVSINISIYHGVLSLHLFNRY